MQGCPEQLERPAGFPSSDKTRPDSPVPNLQGPCGRSPKRRTVFVTCGFFWTMHGGVSAPSCCAFTHRVSFEERSGPRVLLKSGPGNRGTGEGKTTWTGLCSVGEVY